LASNNLLKPILARQATEMSRYPVAEELRRFAPLWPPQWRRAQRRRHRFCDRALSPLGWERCGL